MTRETPNDPVVFALAALAATLGNQPRAQRLLDLTGIGTDDLRERADDPVLLAALIAFLEAHQPDLISVAEEIGVEPAILIAARQQLEGNLGPE